MRSLYTAGLQKVCRVSKDENSAWRFFSRKRTDIKTEVETQDNVSEFQSAEADSIDNIDDDLSGFKRVSNAHRGRRERSDSVTTEIFRERLVHQQRAEKLIVDEASVTALEALGLGMKRKKHIMFSHFTSTAAGGTAVHVGSAKKDFPIFKHLLPEIVFAGHTNSGKSTLVNAMSGIHPRLGPAGVSDRAGWTDNICFYQLGKKPPVLTLVDLPGYGHAIASPKQMKDWNIMSRDYLANRVIISRCCILVDCCRGLCDGDKTLIRYLHKLKIQIQIILTKADLLNPLMLAQSIEVVKSDLKTIFDELDFPKPQLNAASDRRDVRKSEGRKDIKIRSIYSEQIGERIKHERNVDSKSSIEVPHTEQNLNSNISAEFFDTTSLASPVDCVIDEDEFQVSSELPALSAELNYSLEKADGNDDDLEIENDGSSSHADKKKLNAVVNVSAAVKSNPTTSTNRLWSLRLDYNDSVIPVSASTGAGINHLWKNLVECVQHSVRIRSLNGELIPSNAVKEHVLSMTLRRKAAATSGVKRR